MDSAELIGTPLTSDRERKRIISDPKSFSKNSSDQIVTDNEGRRRFHGAFTGGFSAGYFNTVGSREGWKPSSFSSSRANRAERIQQRPEDFMDEEDDPMLGRKLDARLEYDTLGERTRKVAQAQAKEEARSSRSIIPGDMPDELIVASSNSIGVRLMKTMGWREGQGVGPLQRVDMSGRRVHEDGRTTIDPHAAGLKFAPRNVKVNTITAKSDNYGIGYRNALEFGSSKRKPNKETLAGMSGGIGTSVLEDDDDIDVYEQDDFGSYTFGAAGSISRQRKIKDKPSSKLVPIYGPFPGFCLAQHTDQVNTYNFKEIKVPDNFVPRHVFSSDYTAPDVQNKSLTPSERGIALGQVRVQDKSVFQLLSRESQKKLERALGKSMQERPQSAATPQGRAAEGALASRFISSSGSQRDSSLIPGLRGPRLTQKASKDKELESNAKDRKPLIIKLQRRSIPWLPDRLLCKRFNIPVPEVQQFSSSANTEVGKFFDENLFASRAQESVPENVEIAANKGDLSLFKEIFDKTGSDEATSFDESSEDDVEDVKGVEKEKQIQTSEKQEEEENNKNDAFNRSVRFLSRSERLGGSRRERKKKIVSHRELFNDDETEQKTTIIQDVDAHTDDALPEWVKNAMSSTSISTQPISKHKKKKEHKKKKKKKKHKSDK